MGKKSFPGVDNGDRKVAPKTTAPPQMEIRTIRVLLVEDNLEDVTFLRRTLQRVSGTHFQLETVTRLSDASAKLKEGDIDVVLVDLTLPDSAGLETFHIIKSQARDTPVIVLSGLDDETVAVNAVHAGAEDYLVKGRVDSQLITRAIIYAMERMESRRALLKAEENFQPRRRENIWTSTRRSPASMGMNRGRN